MRLRSRAGVLCRHAQRRPLAGHREGPLTLARLQAHLGVAVVHHAASRGVEVARDGSVASVADRPQSALWPARRALAQSAGADVDRHSAGGPGSLLRTAASEGGSTAPGPAIQAAKEPKELATAAPRPVCLRRRRFAQPARDARSRTRASRIASGARDTIRSWSSLRTTWTSWSHSMTT